MYNAKKRQVLRRTVVFQHNHSFGHAQKKLCQKCMKQNLFEWKIKKKYTQKEWHKDCGIIGNKQKQTKRKSKINW